MDHFANIPTHSAKRHKSCQILSPSQNTLSDTQQHVTNTAKFCPPLKTYSQTLSNTSSILSNSVPLSKRTLRHSAIRHQSCQILSPLECWRAGHEDEDQSAQALNREKPAVRVFAYAVSESANAKHPPWGSNPRPQG